jgi:hypothetical protein
MGVEPREIRAERHGDRDAVMVDHRLPIAAIHDDGCPCRMEDGQPNEKKLQRILETQRAANSPVPAVANGSDKTIMRACWTRQQASFA